MHTHTPCTHIYTNTHTHAEAWLTSVKDFRAVRRKLPKGAVFNLQYETWLKEERRMSVLGRLVDFIGAFARCAAGCVLLCPFGLSFALITPRVPSQPSVYVCMAFPPNTRPSPHPPPPPQHHLRTGLNANDNPKARRRRLQCAFALAQEASGGRRGSHAIQAMDETKLSALVTAEEAFPPEVACPMWEVLGPAAKSMGYTLPNGLTEAACRAVRRSARSS
jgi:hypothetical protein